jgi:hypothetical protein
MAFKKEEELVELHRGNHLSYNLRKGGSGGFDYMNRNGFSSLGGKRSWAGKKKRRDENPESRIKQDAASRRNIAIAKTYVTLEMQRKNQAKGVAAWTGRHHSDEYRKRKSQELLGANNPRYGQMWINLCGMEKVIPLKELEAYSLQGWLKGRSKRYWVEPFMEPAKPKPIRLGRPTKGTVRKARRTPKSEWKRVLPDWPSDDELLRIVAEIGQRALSRKMGISNVAVHNHLKKIGSIV